MSETTCPRAVISQVLCLPFYMDQPDVASRVVDVGAGLSVDKASLSSCVLSQKIDSLLTDEAFSGERQIHLYSVTNC